MSVDTPIIGNGNIIINKSPKIRLYRMQTADLIHGIFISDSNGHFLVKYINDTTLKPELLSCFLSGLFAFGKESVGMMKEIKIKGLDMEVIVVYKYDLLLTAIFSSQMKKSNLQAEAAIVLDLFYERFQQEIQDWDGALEIFHQFELDIKNQVDLYFERMQVQPTNQSFSSFFQRLVQKIKNS